ncbi:transcriptional regulator with XRE-family HTH domain [Nocardioides sp. BE266]|uniref:helix-turn-helix transcriptional regulator n=1 Tax=Nocardioides sp. BE266 TaxID=2817725 RepID=UPI0028622D0B|nr:helix-turn-helix transcriptional regulator [Nocardioides sp. BE266]MDR7252260.1 transcriptional regulator with XRE-family HTH domain [Nocardioides sp. BE266]
MPNTKTGSHRPLPESTARSLAAALRAQRESAGLTQEDLAGRAHVSVQVVRRLEAATANPTLGTLHAVTTALDISWTDLLIEVAD